MAAPDEPITPPLHRAGTLVTALLRARAAEGSLPAPGAAGTKPDEKGPRVTTDLKWKEYKVAAECSTRRMGRLG